MSSNQEQPASVPQAPQEPNQPSSNPVLRNRPLMIVFTIVAAFCVIALVWACLAFFRFI